MNNFKYDRYNTIVDDVTIIVDDVPLEIFVKNNQHIVEEDERPAPLLRSSQMIEAKPINTAEVVSSSKTSNKERTIFSQHWEKKYSNLSSTFTLSSFSSKLTSSTSSSDSNRRNNAILCDGQQKTQRRQQEQKQQDQQQNRQKIEKQRTRIERYNRRWRQKEQQKEQRQKIQGHRKDVNVTYTYSNDHNFYEAFELIRFDLLQKRKYDGITTRSSSNFNDDDDNVSINTYSEWTLQENEDGNRISSTKTVMLMRTRSDTALFAKTSPTITSSCIRKGRFSTKNDSNNIEDTMNISKGNLQQPLPLSKSTSSMLTVSTSSSTLASTVSSSSMVSFGSKVQVHLYQPPIEQWADEGWSDWFV